MRVLRALHDDPATSPPPQARADIRADINVTPLVDVVLVLLIIFMVVTPLIASGVAVDLPRTANHLRKPDDGKDVSISVTADKHLYVGATRAAGVPELASAVVLELRRSPQKSVFLKADARAPYGIVRQVMEALHDNDLNDIVLGTEERQKQ